MNVNGIFHYLLKHFILGLLALVLSSCVGTVQDAKTKLNEIFTEPAVYLSFGGISEARPISHNKIEVEFYPMLGATNDIRYFLYLNGTENPIEINPEALDDALGGKKRYVLKNLEINTYYKLKLKVKNIVTKAYSNNEKEITVKTFDNRTADFLGINNVSKVVGASSTAIKIEWVPAKMLGVFDMTPYDPVYYEITAISAAGGPQNLNNSNYLGTDKLIIKTTVSSPQNHPSFEILTGLTPETTYYVQVRAVNKLYRDLAALGMNPMPVSREINSRYLKIKTDKPSFLPEFSKESVTLQNTPGEDAYTKINVYWGEGEGTFNKYRVFWKEFSGDNSLASPVPITDEITTAFMQNASAGSSYVDANTSLTSLRINNLNPYKWIQVKVALCPTSACTIATGAADDAQVSFVKNIRTQAVLAPFGGIISLENPKDSAHIDQVKATFDPPTLSVGYADTLDTYCLDPNDYTRYVKLTTSAVNLAGGSAVGNCNGLALDNLPEVKATSILINGVKNINSQTDVSKARYCFAMTPAIRGKAEPKPNPLVMSDLIVRCISPEIKVPTLNEFPGLSGNCNVNQNTASVSWAVPSAGIYNAFRVYIREIVGSLNFKFLDAASLPIKPGYGSGPPSSGNLTATPVVEPPYYSYKLSGTTVNYTFTDLKPGRKYKVGVLAVADSGGNEILSEYNINLKECNIPLPKATFQEWTRVFAIGPKIDGRFPLESPNRFMDDAHIWEAINADGIPYEVKMNGANLDNTSFVPAPGNYSATSPYLTSGTFTKAMDGAPSASGNYASKLGIISLAWKDVTLDFMQSEFSSMQDLNESRNTRTYGYKVYRSDDNRLTWIDVTPASKSGLLHASNFSYLKRSNAPVVTEKMLFFTDYSVQYALANSVSGADRARTYWYKVVPYFDNKPLIFEGDSAGSPTPPNFLKVTLPPPNTALIHRMMANRQACLEIDESNLTSGPNPLLAPKTRTLDKSPGGHYTCDYDGLGARPKNWNWKSGETVIDQGGDLLVDRYELGCQYTRGELHSEPDPTTSSSYYIKNSVNYQNSQTGLYDFHGYATGASNSDSNKVFKGCANTYGKLDSMGPPSPDSTGYTPSYKSVLWGDCLHSTNSQSFPTSSCPVYQYSTSYSFPGIINASWFSKWGLNHLYVAPNWDCTNDSSTNPQSAATLFTPDWRRNLLTQSEFAAVNYSRSYSSSYYSMTNYGPDPTDPSKGASISTATLSSSWSVMRNCYVNLAAIGADSGWRARWFSAGELYSMKLKKADGSYYTENNFYTKKVGDILNNGALYNNSANSEYKSPGAAFTNSNRFNSNTPIGRVFSSNSAKLPPISGIVKEKAEVLCSTYQVEVGFGDDRDGAAAFFPTSFPYTKSLLNKLNIITANAWPETTNYNSTNITDIERRNSVTGTPASNAKFNGCINNAHDIASSNTGVYWKSSLSPKMTLGSMSGDIPLFTGSSSLDYPISESNPHNSEKCISRYGIQDLIGNLWETSNFLMNCDYSLDKIYFGTYTGSPKPKIDYTTGTPSLGLSARLPSYSNSSTLIWQDASITGPDFTQSGNIVWFSTDPQSGYCSIVDKDATRPNFPSTFIDNSSNLKNIWDVYGNLVTAIVPYANRINQESVNYLRNGDGFFLNFGVTNLAPPMNSNNSLSLNDAGVSGKEVAQGTYFNPIIGLTLACNTNDVTGNDTCNNDDNTRITTSWMMIYKNGDFKSETKIQDFPVGNSQIFNEGISDYIYQPADDNATSDDNGITTYTFNQNSGNPNNSYRIIVEIIVSGPQNNMDNNGFITHLSDSFKTREGITGTPRAPLIISKSISELYNNGYTDSNGTLHTFTNGQTINVYKPSFTVPRNSDLTMVTGGGYTTYYTGRYTSETKIANEMSDRGSFSTGMRCGVMVNLED